MPQYSHLQLFYSQYRYWGKGVSIPCVLVILTPTRLEMAVSTPTQRRYSSAVFAIFSAHKNTCRSANIVFNTGLQNFVSLRVSRMSWHKQDRSKKNPWGFEKHTPVKKKHGRVNTCDRSLKAKPIIKRAAVVAH